MQKFSDLFGIPSKETPANSFLKVYGYGDGGSLANNCFYFPFVLEDSSGFDFDYENSSKYGTFITIKKEGLYSFKWNYGFELSIHGSVGYADIAIIKNGVGGPPLSEPAASSLGLIQIFSAAVSPFTAQGEVSAITSCKPGDVIRFTFSNNNAIAVADKYIMALVSRLA